MDKIVLTILGVLILISCGGVIAFTLMLNTKSEGLGAAVTGASDNYRGAIGVEDQKRRMQYFFSVAFVILSVCFTLAETYL
jgi:protein translocase SecG subunit